MKKDKATRKEKKELEAFVEKKVAEYMFKKRPLLKVLIEGIERTEKIDKEDVLDKYKF